jgi:SAM-dependent methyltransferase
MPDSWHDEATARHYQDFNRRFRLYQAASEDLVALADFGPEATVVDLACGTGVTTQVIVSRLGPGGRVTAVDSSAAMLAIAAGEIADQRVSWLRCRAEDLAGRLTGPVDAVICNAAIWQADFGAVASAVGRLLAPGGRFVFNVGAGLLAGTGPVPPLPSVLQAIAAREYGWSPPAPARPPAARLSDAAIRDGLAAAGLTVESVRRLSYPQSADMLRAWLSVPVFTAGQLPGLAYDARLRVVEVAAAELREPGDSQWLAFVARR